MNLLKRFAVLFPVLLMFFIDFMGIGLVYPLFSSMFFAPNSSLLPLDTSQAMRGFILGLVLALMPLAQFFSGPILGTFSDRLGRKRLILTSIAFGVLGYVIAVFGVCWNNVWILALSRIMVGIAAGNEAVGSAAIVDVSSSEDKAKNFGLFHMAAGFGFTVGPFLGGKLAMTTIGMFSGYVVPFLFAAGLSMINFILVLALFHETHKPQQTVYEKVSFGFANIGKAWRMSTFFFIFLAVFVFYFGWDFYWAFIPVTWIKQYGLDANSVGNFYAWGAIFYAISAGVLIQPVVARLKPERALLFSLVACAVSLAAPLFFAPLWMYWFYIPVQQYFIALIFPVAATIISNMSSDETQGEVMGIYQSVQSLAVVVGPLVSGMLLGFSFLMPLIVGACALLLAAGILNRSLTIKK